MPPLRKILLNPSLTGALGLFLVILAMLYLPAFAQGRICADDVAKFCTRAPRVDEPRSSHT